MSADKNLFALTVDVRDIQKKKKVNIVETPGANTAKNPSVMASMLGVDAASREREDRKQAERVARHRSAIQAIKDFKFDGGDESSIKANAIRFLGEYTTCNPGLFEDKDYKKAYINRIETELKNLKASNEALYQELI